MNTSIQIFTTRSLILSPNIIAKLREDFSLKGDRAAQSYTTAQQNIFVVTNSHFKLLVWHFQHHVSGLLKYGS